MTTRSGQFVEGLATPGQRSKVGQMIRQRKLSEAWMQTAFPLISTVFDERINVPALNPSDVREVLGLPLSAGSDRPYSEPKLDMRKWIIESDSGFQLKNVVGRTLKPFEFLRGGDCIDQEEIQRRATRANGMYGLQHAIWLRDNQKDGLLQVNAGNPFGFYLLLFPATVLIRPDDFSTQERYFPVLSWKGIGYYRWELEFWPAEQWCVVTGCPTASFVTFETI